MVKQVNVKFTSSEDDLQTWLKAQNNASGSVKILIRQAIARYGTSIDINDALIRESLHHVPRQSQNIITKQVYKKKPIGIIKNTNKGVF